MYYGSAASGYRVRDYGVPVKRYCRTLRLRPDAALVAEYRRRHLPGSIWPEIPRGIREIGILEMEIYIHGFTAFMIVETELDFDWDTAMSRLASLPRQQEWEDYMSLFQNADTGAASAEKWEPMERVFHLDI